MDEDSCISPTDAQQWMYDRAHGHQSMSSFIENHRNIEEEDEDPEEARRTRRRLLSEVNINKTTKNLISCAFLLKDYQMPVLNDNDQARLLSCMEEIRNVVGESIPDRQLVETILKHEYDFAKSLDELLNEATKPAPQIKLEIEKGESSKNYKKKNLYMLTNVFFFFLFLF